jgi:hypothetical protein
MTSPTDFLATGSGESHPIPGIWQMVPRRAVLAIESIY